MRRYLIATVLLSIPVLVLGISPARSHAQDVDERDDGGRLWSDEAVDDSYRNPESESWYESRYTRGSYGSPYYRGTYYGGPYYYGGAYYGDAYRRGPYADADYGRLYDESQDLDDSYSGRIAFDFEDDEDTRVEYRVARPTYYQDDIDANRYYGLNRDNERYDDVYVRRENLTHLRGEVRGQRISAFRNRDGHYVVVRLRTDDGQTQIVNLGPYNELRQLNLQLGDRLSVFGRRVVVDGQPGLIAQHILANDQTIRVGRTGQWTLRR